MADLSRAPRADSAATRERILDASERLFSERGYSGTSLRAIAQDAGVNLASANYHFGSKDQLLAAALQRSVAKINAERLKRLDDLQAAPNAPDVGDIVRAFIEPALPVGKPHQLPQLLARVLMEPKAISVPLLESTFRPIASRFLASLHKALPSVALEDLQWRFIFVIGGMLQLARFNELPMLFGLPKLAKSADPAAGLEQLIAFAIAGLRQNSSAGARS